MKIRSHLMTLVVGLVMGGLAGALLMLRHHSIRQQDWQQQHYLQDVEPYEAAQDLVREIRVLRHIRGDEQDEAFVRSLENDVDGMARHVIYRLEQQSSESPWWKSFEPQLIDPLAVVKDYRSRHSPSNADPQLEGFLRTNLPLLENRPDDTTMSSNALHMFGR